MTKSIISFQISTRLFDPDNYESLPDMSTMSNYSLRSFDVCGSSEIDESLSLMFLAHIDYAQIDIYLDLTMLLSWYLRTKKETYISCLIGVHKNPKHQSRMQFIG